jgi:hypothetical protein
MSSSRLALSRRRLAAADSWAACERGVELIPVSGDLTMEVFLVYAPAYGGRICPSLALRSPR